MQINSMKTENKNLAHPENIISAAHCGRQGYAGREWTLILQQKFEVRIDCFMIGGPFKYAVKPILFQKCV